MPRKNESKAITPVGNVLKELDGEEYTYGVIYLDDGENLRFEGDYEITNDYLVIPSANRTYYIDPNHIMMVELVRR